MGVEKMLAIEDIAEKIIDYRGKTPPKSDNGIRLVTAKVIKNGFIQEERAEYISEDTYTSWMRRGYPQQHDIVITTEAPLGEVAQLRTTEKVALAQRVILLRAKRDLMDQQYFYQALKSPMVQANLQQRATGTTVFGIKQSELRKVEVPYFPLPTQRKIAAILSAYDDLIENNLRRIKILEEMAQNLYREWFVNFRFPGHEKARFVDSPLGKIPEGWEITLLENACERITDGAHRSPKTTLHGYPMASVKDMHNWGINIETCRKISEDDFLELTRTDCVMRKGDVLIAKDGSYLKHCIEVEKNFDIALLSSIAILRSNKKTSTTFLLMTLKDENVKNRMKGYVSGAALPRIILKEFRKFPIIIPPSNMQDEFVNIVEYLQRLCWRLLEKNKNLCQARDLLLPKLISGEVDVSELDINVPEEVSA